MSVAILKVMTEKGNLYKVVHESGDPISELANLYKVKSKSTIDPDLVKVVVAR